MRLGEEVGTYGTVEGGAYKPTKEKPFQGIWCGDYAGHGCEFLLITQPSDPKPLPERAQWAMASHEGEGSVCSVDSGGSTDSLQAAVTSSNSNSGSGTENEEGVADEELVYQGRLEAIKLTGDPNIPRGEYTWIAPDIGAGGLLRVASEEPFRGARVVRSIGHIAANGFRDEWLMVGTDDYMSSQLLIISKDRLAQYWETFGHVSFYERVDLDKFVQLE